jgi:hypothetical protein
LHQHTSKDVQSATLQGTQVKGLDKCLQQTAHVQRGQVGVNTPEREVHIVNEQTQTIELLVINCNRAVRDFSNATRKYDKVKHAVRVQEYQNLFNELANNSLGVQLVDDEFEFNAEVGLDTINFYRAVSYLNEQNRKEQKKLDAIAYDKWYREVYLEGASE